MSARAMFAMLNSARLGASVQGLGIAGYARERLQGRYVGGARHPERIADPIIVHPDVRRMLLTMRAYIEGMRALALWIALALDQRERHPDSGARAKADGFVSH
jgi:alkylation response protein AidB-like acyl-CoA dehydrogenase